MENTMESAGRNSKAVALKVDNGKGGFYRFTAEEVEDMKRGILGSVECDGSAWRYRVCLEGEAYCCARSESERAKRVRKIALYNALTDGNDMPKWLEDSEPHPTDNETTGDGHTLKIYELRAYIGKTESLYTVLFTNMEAAKNKEKKLREQCDNNGLQLFGQISVLSANGDTYEPNAELTQFFNNKNNE